MKKMIMVTVVAVLCLGAAEVKALILNDGGVHTVDWIIDEPVSVEDSPGGDFTTLNLIDGGSIALWLNALDNSEINIIGGSVQDDLWAYHYSRTIISSGSITDDLNTSHNSKIFISGGSIGDEIDVRDYSEVTIFGSAFEIDGIPVGYGQITTGIIDEFGRLTGTLTGLLQSGDPLNNVYYIQPDAFIYLVPEPATLLLISVGSLIIRTC